MSHASVASISITGLSGVVSVMIGKGRFSGLFLSLTISAGFLSSNGINSSSIKFFYCLTAAAAEEVSDFLKCYPTEHEYQHRVLLEGQ